MITIGTTRIEGIDWVQEQLGFIPRPLAEQTYFGLLRKELIVESKSDVAIAQDLHGDELRNAAKVEDVINKNNSRRAQMTKRHHSPTTKRSRIVNLHQGNTIDCATDEIYQ